MDIGCVSCQMVCCWGYYWGDNWLCDLSNGVLLELLLGRQLVVCPVKWCAAGVITGVTVGCVSCQMVCCWHYYWGDNWLCVLSNGVLHGFLLGRQLVVCRLKWCAAGIITGDTIGCVSCQMVCCWDYYWGDNWLCILSNSVVLGLLLGRQLVLYPVKLCAAGVITGETIGCVSCRIVCCWGYYWGVN